MKPIRYLIVITVIMLVQATSCIVAMADEPPTMMLIKSSVATPEVIQIIQPDMAIGAEADLLYQAATNQKAMGPLVLISLKVQQEQRMRLFLSLIHHEMDDRDTRVWIRELTALPVPAQPSFRRSISYRAPEYRATITQLGYPSTGFATLTLVRW